jgi:hypothetical protein
MRSKVYDVHKKVSSMVHTMKKRLGRNVVLCVLFCSFFTVSCHLQDKGRTDPFAAVQTTVYLNQIQSNAPPQSSQNNSSSQQSLKQQCKQEWDTHNAHMLNSMQYIPPCDDSYLREMSTEELYLYFSCHGYSQQQILEKDTLYMSNAFVALVKEFPEYFEYIEALHKKLSKMSGTAKWSRIGDGLHIQGLTRQVEDLYHAAQWEKELKELRQKQQKQDELLKGGCKNPNCSIDLYEKLKLALKIEGFLRVIDVTKHGIQRLIERGFTLEETADLIKNPHYIRVQLDGAKVFIQNIADRYKIMVLNEVTREIITALKNTKLKKIIDLGKRYGWKL